MIANKLDGYSPSVWGRGGGLFFYKLIMAMATVIFDWGSKREMLGFGGISAVMRNIYLLYV